MNIRRLVALATLATIAFVPVESAHASNPANTWKDCISLNSPGKYDVTPGSWTQNGIVIGQTWIGGGSVTGPTAAPVCNFIRFPAGVVPNDFHYSGDQFTDAFGNVTIIYANFYWSNAILPLDLPIYVGLHPFTNLTMNLDYTSSPSNPILNLIKNGVPETFERDRRLCPVTMPFLVEEPSRFILHLEVAPLPARGGLSKKHRKRLRELEAREGVRRSGSREAVKRCFEQLASVLRPGVLVIIHTDRKSSYVTILAEAMPGLYVHERTSGKEPKDKQNPLWVVNHTQAMSRDGASRLVRRSWGVSKERAWLELHAWVWVAYRNYIRGYTNKKKRVTAAQLAGVVDRRYTKHGFFEWRVLDAA